MLGGRQQISTVCPRCGSKIPLNELTLGLDQYITSPAIVVSCQFCSYEEIITVYGEYPRDTDAEHDAFIAGKEEGREETEKDAYDKGVRAGRNQLSEEIARGLVQSH